ncbi:MgtC/SapB family protein [Deferribacteraceae bacterium V6Fe1]|nr:MgtC/SapB family protein [Deferribacteraceae bacterium V6Fe1]
MSTALALLIGVERQYSVKNSSEKEAVAGVRTFSLVGILAYLSGFLTIKLNYLFGVAGFLTVLLLAGLGYIRDFPTKGRGLTTEIALVVTFLSSYLISVGYRQVGVVSGVVLFTFLSNKDLLHGFVGKLTKDDFVATLKFLMLAAIIYPLLPDKSFMGISMLNPAGVFKIVVLIAGISFMGYAGIRLVGAKKGLIVSAILGSFVSSTAVTINLSNFYKSNKESGKLLTSGIVLGCTIMFVRVLVLVWVFNNTLFKYALIYFLPAIIFLLVFSGISLKKASKDNLDNFKVDNPVSISSAVKFGLLLLAIILLADFMKKNFGDAGVLVLAAISGVSDVDAITVLMSKMAFTDSGNDIYLLGIIVASIVNSLVKGFLAVYIGGRNFGLRVLSSLFVGSVLIVIFYFLNTVYSLF